jgi:hypothetical protein
MELVIVERVFAEPVDLNAIMASLEANAGCFEMRRVKLQRSMLARDGLRMVCEYLAPDAESVREANERAGMPFERVWTARVIVEGGCSV